MLLPTKLRKYTDANFWTKLDRTRWYKFGAKNMICTKFSKTMVRKIKVKSRRESTIQTEVNKNEKFKKFAYIVISNAEGRCKTIQNKILLRKCGTFPLCDNTLCIPSYNITILQITILQNIIR